jgi:hypothetical protein
MSTTAPKPATTPIPVQLSAPEFEAFILPHLSMPKRGPKCKLGYYRVFNLILWVLYTGMQWKCLPRKAKKLAPLYSRRVTSPLCSSLWPVSYLAILRYATVVALQGEIPYKIAPFFGIHRGPDEEQIVYD